MPNNLKVCYFLDQVPMYLCRCCYVWNYLGTYLILGRACGLGQLHQAHQVATLMTRSIKRILST
jgi:hypothetical protein